MCSRENVRRCFTLNLYRCTMIVVNFCHILAIVIVIRNIIASRNGGRPIEDINVQREFRKLSIGGISLLSFRKGSEKLDYTKRSLF
ncbi:hypothetical protein ANCDUO_07201 [Ancylostoma duodenale]|uniref:Uncharacterized protein n=1 Tax=Ancylostoma duodenale TaxID=51022 RepID=A0A0C2DJ48_9BILA|nr:hypothetical protein ANCDUO_07201 [Ancylostoma duodenale]